MSEYRLKIGEISLQRGWFDPEFQVEGVTPTTNSFSQKTSLNDILYGIKIWTYFSSVLSQFTHLSDGQTPFSRLDCPVFNAVR